jgi:AcrR family transcriptional regulator
MGKRQIAAMQTRMKIVLAAEKLIKERGIEDISVEDITNEAGVAKGSFYTYFKRKEDVGTEIANAIFDKMRQEVVTEGQDVYRQITAFLSSSIDFIAESGVRGAQQWIKNVVDPSFESEKTKYTYDSGVIRQMLADGVKSGELREDTPIDELTDIVIHAYYGTVFCWAIRDGGIDPAKCVRMYCENQLRDTIEKYKNKPSK